MIRITSDYSDIDAELDRLSRLPEGDDTGALDLVLEFGFSEVQAAVHKDTTSLAQSGKKTSETKDGEWVGEIEHGGSSTGVNNPVDYAIYEKARGGDHDFTAPLDDLDPLYVEAIKTVLVGK